MGRTRTRIRVPIEFDRWIEGLEDLDPGPEVLQEWAAAMERFYGHSQETVHVITSALRSTGRHDTQMDGKTRVEGTLTYGGMTVTVPGYGRSREVDYAIHEHNRGGDHAWITEAFRLSRRDFERALADGVQRHVEGML